jgi:diadenosine tetraphosphate (Ap4A) HIT family hydrolase
MSERRPKLMGGWNRTGWAALCSGEACPICLRGRPIDVIHELPFSYLTASTHGPMRGYCCVVLKRHAVEMHDLPDDEAIGFTRDIQRAARAIQEVTRAVKLNYEIHGNTLPHLHMHVYPRYQDDPFRNGPIDPRLVKASPYRAGEFDAFVAALRTRMTCG